MRTVPRDQFTAPVLDAIAAVRMTMPSLRWLLFGSILTSKRPVGDVDLLVIYVSDDEPTKVRRDLAPVTAQVPLQLLFMTAEEEIETRFIRNTGAVELM